jgi:hypothetical protein
MISSCSAYPKLHTSIYLHVSASSIKFNPTIVSGYPAMTMVVFHGPVRTGQWINKRHYKFANDFLKAGIHGLTHQLRK